MGTKSSKPSKNETITTTNKAKKHNPWACSTCTFENHGKVNNCGMCGTAKPQSSHAQHVQPHPPHQPPQAAEIKETSEKDKDEKPVSIVSRVLRSISEWIAGFTDVSSKDKQSQGSVGSQSQHNEREPEHHQSIGSDFKVLVAIDLGTYGTALAYGMVGDHDEDNIYIEQDWCARRSAKKRPIYYCRMKASFWLLVTVHWNCLVLWLSDAYI
eukprot:550162_1